MIVGGTVFSLILTLFVIPAVYLMWSRGRKPHPDIAKAEAFERETLKPV